MHQLEGDFWRNVVKPQFEKHGIYFKRIESPVTPGFPDTIVLINGVTSLIEIKSKPKMMPNLGCTQLQKHVLSSWITNGGSSYLLAQAADEILLVRGDSIPPAPSLDPFTPLIRSNRKSFQWAELSLILQQPLKVK